ncbi:hypothetical protein PJF56_03785, partial [Roseofilum sp. BLCC_M91]|nr:hypothetical protein [Roseofilum halophilum BLCC-M91]
EPLELSEKKVWLEELGLGLALWQGEYEGVEGLWLRFYDPDGNWIPTPSERAQQAESELQQLRDKLRQLNIDPDSL